MTQVLESLDWHDTGGKKASLDVIFLPVTMLARNSFKNKGSSFNLSGTLNFKIFFPELEP